MAARVRRPARGPNPSDVQDRDRWEELVNTSLPRTQAAAEKWRTGLAAFVTLVTGSLFLKGPESAASLSNGWLAGLTALAAGGLAAAVFGLWLGLRAAAGAPSAVTYEAVRGYGGVKQYEVAAARLAAAALNQAKVAVAIALALLGLASFVWWWAPTEPSDPAARVAVVTAGDKTVCGTLISADQQQLRIQVAGESEARTIAFVEVANVGVVASC